MRTIHPSGDDLDLRISRDTLRKWGAVRSAVPRVKITALGCTLLASLDKKFGKAHGSASDDSGKSTPTNRSQDSLVRASADLQDAHAKPRAAGREDVCQLLRKAAWQVAAALSDCVADQSSEVVS